MIVVLKKSNIALIVLTFVLLMAIFSFNLNADKKTVNEISDGVLDTSGQVNVVNEPKSKTIILDAGHGGEDPGAVSEYSGLKEKDVNLKIAFRIKELLEEENYKIIMTRTEDILQYEDGTTNIYEKRKQDLTKRKKTMDETGADIVVSIHLNKFSQSQYYGAQVFYPPESPESRRLANVLQTVLREQVDPTNKRVAMEKKPLQGQKPIMILRDLKTPTVIVECGFLSNAEEEKKLGSEEYQNKLSNAIKEGIIKYFSED